MSLRKSLAAIAILGITLGACDQGGEKTVTTPNGVKYTYHVDNESTAPVEGDIVSFNFDLYEADKDSLLITSREQPLPAITKITGDSAIAMLEEGLKLCSEGDSVTFYLNSDDLPQGVFGVQPNTNLKFVIAMLKVQTEADFMAEREAEARKAEEEHKVTDDATIQAYLSENNIEAQKTESGLYYQITSEGQGDNPTQNTEVEVHYNGTLLDGTKFDSSYDRGETFKFTLGTGGVIRGWDEGIALLNKGAKATLFIPSHLGYGARGAGQMIPPFSILKFDVELVSF